MTVTTLLPRQIMTAAAEIIRNAEAPAIEAQITTLRCFALEPFDFPLEADEDIGTLAACAADVGGAETIGRFAGGREGGSDGGNITEAGAGEGEPLNGDGDGAANGEGDGANAGGGDGEGDLNTWE